MTALALGVEREARPVAVVIGGGVAGMSCALWLKHLGFDPLLVDRSVELGGQLLQIRRINRWVLGFHDVLNTELATTYANHLRDEKVRVELGTELTQVMRQERGFAVEFRRASGPAIQSNADAIVIATGARPRGGEEFEGTNGWADVAATGNVSFFPLDHLDCVPALEGREFAVVGGGDNAYFTTRDLARHAARVHLVSRSEPSAQPLLRAEIAGLVETGRVVEYRKARCSVFRPHPDGVELTIVQPGTEPVVLRVARVFARLGFAPGTDFVDRFPALAGMVRDHRGFLVGDGWRRTSITRVYAAGDVVNPMNPSVVAALADGALAARAVAQDCDPRRQ